MADEREVNWPDETERETMITHDSSGNGEVSEDESGRAPVLPLEARGPLSTPSIVDLFKAEQEELAETKSVFIPVKGYEKTGLQIKYRMPGSGREIEAIATKINRQFKDTYARNLYSAMDVMIHLCDGLYVQPEGVPEPVPLDSDDSGIPCTFDVVLAELLGMDSDSEDTTARSIVKKLFGGNELAVMSHAFDLNRWLANTKADLNLEIWQVGE
jgi:hypothetical protein